MEKINIDELIEQINNHWKEMRKLSLELNDIRSNKSDDKIYFKVEENFKSFDDVYDKYLELLRLFDEYKKYKDM